LIKVSVTDQGIGIAEEDHNNLFNPYFKTSSMQSRRINKESHGLGLHICKKIANNLGGDLNYNSMYVDGAQFILSLTTKIYVAPIQRPKPDRTFFKRSFGRKNKKKPKSEFEEIPCPIYEVENEYLESNISYG
jgi:hypothetical protein